MKNISKKHFSFYFVVLFIILFLIFTIIKQNRQTPQILWYGIPMKISLSGDFRFYRTDEFGNKIDNKWFWVIPKNLNDEDYIDSVYNELLNNSGRIFKIQGVKDKDDCDYYRAGELLNACISTIILDNISVLSK